MDFQGQPEEYDLLILGSGAGAKVPAWTFGARGQRVAVVERKYVGGSCPNIACLPIQRFPRGSSRCSLPLPLRAGTEKLLAVRGAIASGACWNLQKDDVPAQWSCRTDAGHLCEWLDGRLHCAPKSLDQPATGNALICRSTPQSQVELDL
jgi:hypothetical protein